MRGDDMILISVDDHIAEPADMFDAHVPAKYRDRAPRVVTDENGYQQWWYGEKMGRNLGLNAVAGKPPEMFNVNPQRYDEMRPGLLRRRRARARHVGGRPARRAQLPELDRLLGPGAQRGSRPRRQRGHDPAPTTTGTSTSGAAPTPTGSSRAGSCRMFDVELAAAEVRRLASKGCHAVTFSENPAALRMPSIHSGAWDPLFAACCDVSTVLCLHVGSSSRSSATTDDAPASVPMSLSSLMSTYSLGDLMWADFWWRFPELKFSLTEGDIGWIPYFLQRAEHIQRRHSGWTRHEFPDGWGPAEVFRAARPVLLHQRRDRREAARRVQPRQRLLGVRLPALRQLVAERARGARGAPRRSARRRREPDHPRERDAPLPLRPVRRRARASSARSAALRAEAPDVDTVTHVGRPARRERRRLLPAPPGAASSAIGRNRLRHPSADLLDRKCLAPHTVAHWATVTPDAVALEHVDGERLTYAQLHADGLRGAVRTGRARGAAR